MAKVWSTQVWKATELGELPKIVAGKAVFHVKLKRKRYLLKINMNYFTCMHTLQLSFWDIRGKCSFFRNLPHINHMRNDTKMLNGVVSAGSYKMNCLKAEVGLSFDISLFTKRDKNWITQSAFFSKSYEQDKKNLINFNEK